MVFEKLKLDTDCDIQQKKVHFFELFDHQQQNTTPIGFYNHFWNLVIASLQKKGDIIMWQKSTMLTEDEQLSPTFEELILAIVLGLIDSRLPGHVKDHYHHLLGTTKSFMDYRTDILDKVPS